MAQWKRRITGVVEILEEFNDDISKIPSITEKLIVLLKEDRAYPSDRELRSVVEDLEVFQGEEDVPYFDRIMQGLYDWADDARVWIEPLPERVA
jgi:hypothetical protein